MGILRVTVFIAPQRFIYPEVVQSPWSIINTDCVSWREITHSFNGVHLVGVEIYLLFEVYSQSEDKAC